MAFAYSYSQGPFWDFVRSFDPTGAGAGVGVDHAQSPFEGAFWTAPQHPSPPAGSFPQMFGADPCRGRRGRRCRRGGGAQEHHCGSRAPGADGPDNEGAHFQGTHGFGPHGRRGECGTRGRHGGPSPPFPFNGGSAFDLNALFAALPSQPWATALRDYASQAGFMPDDTALRSGETTAQTTGSGEATAAAAGEAEDENSFTPPLDIFSTPTAYTIHVALPGAKKEDVGVDWDSEKSVLNIAGVVYRAGDEEFLKSMTKGERKVGAFERAVKLPLEGEEEEKIDDEGISAKLEDGVLVIKVGKMEREWVDLKRVDIE